MLFITGVCGIQFLICCLFSYGYLYHSSHNFCLFVSFIVDNSAKIFTLDKLTYLLKYLNWVI